MWLLYILVGIVFVVGWLFLGSRDHCPSCGVPFEDSIFNRIDAAVGKRPTRCTRCGWRRREGPG